MIVNGRISDRACPRYRRWRCVFPARAVLARRDSGATDEDRGDSKLPARRPIVFGRRKSEVRFHAARRGSPPKSPGFWNRVSPAKIWIAASTMPPACRRRSRRRRRRDRGVPQVCPRWSAADSGSAQTGAIRRGRRKARARRDPFRPPQPRLRSGRLPRVLLLDSIGELAALFERADVVFMGGTLAHRGGHNILEPAYFGKPIIVGPHMENFAAIADEFQRSRRAPANRERAVTWLAPSDSC